MGQKEAKACIKINKLLEEAGWRLFLSKGLRIKMHELFEQILND